jgi:hypothetical protein
LSELDSVPFSLSPKASIGKSLGSIQTWENLDTESFDAT